MTAAEKADKDRAFSARARSKFSEILRGKHVVVVGNGALAPGDAKKIDAAETVFRCNHARGLGGDAGNKITALAIMPAMAWLNKSAEEQHIDAIARAGALIFGTYWERTRHTLYAYFPKNPVFPLPDAETPTGNVPADTGTRLLYAIAGAAACGAKPARFDIYGFSFGDDFDRYVRTEGAHYIRLPGYDTATEDARRRALIFQIRNIALNDAELYSGSLTQEP